MRTHPRFSEMLLSGSPLPKANSVEPPPMSSVTNGPRSAHDRGWRRQRRAPPRPHRTGARARADRCAHGSKKSARLAASRAALVPVMRRRVTPWRAIDSA